MTYSEMVSEVVQENQKLRWENAILKNQMDDTNAEKERADKAEALARELVDMLGRVTPRYLAGRLELDLDLVSEANGLLKKAKEVLGDD